MTWLLPAPRRMLLRCRRSFTAHTQARFDHEQVAVFVWRAERAGGDTKTPESRRTLALPRKCVEALREHRVRQAGDRFAAGPLWQDHGLVFASAVGTPMDDHNVRRMFRAITEDAGLGTGWVRAGRSPGTGPRPEFGPARCVSSDGHHRVGRK